MHCEKAKDTKEIENILKRLAEQCSGKGPAHECPILRYLYPLSNSECDKKEGEA